MCNWKSFLNDDATGWLLEDANPSVRYFALRWLLDLPESNREVVAARHAITGSAPVRKIMERQRPAGYWGSDPRPHHGTNGPLTLLLWLGAPDNARIEQAIAYCLDGCLMDDGAYAIPINGRKMLVPCHGAECLSLMLNYGYASDPRTRKLLNWLVGSQEADGVWLCPSKAKRFPCLWATADILRAWRELPAKWITAPVRDARGRAVELLLDSELSHYGRRKPEPNWFRFGFPLRYTSDVLDALESAAPFVSEEDPRIQTGLQAVLDKQDTRGRWPYEKRLNGTRWMDEYVEPEKLGAPSKWITLHAYKMLKTLHSA